MKRSPGLASTRSLAGTASTAGCNATGVVRRTCVLGRWRGAAAAGAAAAAAEADVTTVRCVAAVAVVAATAANSRRGAHVRKMGAVKCARRAAAGITNVRGKSGCGRGDALCQSVYGCTVTVEVEVVVRSVTVTARNEACIPHRKGSASRTRGKLTMRIFSARSVAWTVRLIILM